MNKVVKQFIIVDDDPFNNFLSKTVLRKFFKVAEVKDFLVPEEALDYIRTDYECIVKEDQTILFLDINMPTLSGWEFLDQFDSLSDTIKNKFAIYMLSSSIDPVDIQRAGHHPLIVDFIEKPLNKGVLVELFGF